MNAVGWSAGGWMVGAGVLVLGLDWWRYGSSPNSCCIPVHCAIVPSSASFVRSDALSFFYCFLLAVPDLPRHTGALRCNFFFNLPFQCCLGRLCGAREGRGVRLGCGASRGLCAVARVVLVCEPEAELKQPSCMQGRAGSTPAGCAPPPSSFWCILYANSSLNRLKLAKGSSL